MATLDTRLLPLIEMLSRAGLDWLGLELMEGVRLGRPPEEAAEVLYQARLEAGGSQQSIDPELVAESGAEPQPIAGDTQLVWAVGYVVNKLEEAMNDFDAAFSNLEDLCTPDKEAENVQREGMRVSLSLVLLEDEASHKLVANDLEATRNDLGELRHALQGWLAEQIGQGDAR